MSYCFYNYIYEVLDKILQQLSQKENIYNGLGSELFFTPL